MSSWKHSGRQPFVVEEHKTTTNDRHTDDSRYQQLYSAPTVDTLDTQNSLIRPYTSDTDTLNALSEGRNNEAPNVQSSKKRVNEKEFQIPEDSMAVFVRDIAVAQRSAFAMRKPPLPSDITTLNPKKISPSMQHLSLIHQLQSITHTRQLAFTPSVGLSADSLSPEAFNFSISSSSSTKRDGRYRSIDPVKATLDVLPRTPPLLSNKKHRLPLRVDVGFPNASTEEIQQKQKEIAIETEWEEAAPRLIVLVTSDDLGTAAAQEGQEEEGAMPFCGPELVFAKERNNRQFSRKSSLTKKEIQKISYQRRLSMLAPPLDATHSRTMGWRPRPFHDRLPGMHYSLVCPMSLEFAVGNIEPLLCSLTLYSLRGSVTGKTSENFWFPAGDWKGRLSVDLLKKDKDLSESWHHRKHKAIFSHDPIVVPTNDLYIVLQVYKVSHVELAAAYLRGGKQMKRAVDRANAVFESFGTQFMSPLCFGVTNLYPPQEGPNTLAWPQGQIQQNMQLYAYPTQAESQLAFVKRLQSIVGRQEESLQERQMNIPMSSAEKELQSMAEELSLTDSSSQGSKKKNNWFRSPLRSSKKDLNPPLEGVFVETDDLLATDSIDSEKFAIDGTPTIDANVAFFTSSLESDFLQAMLQTPSELMEKRTAKALPQVLIDASGESAIMEDPKNSTESLLPRQVKKRSDLVRLPCRSSGGGGYAEVSDFREVLFLPPRRSKDYSADVPPSYRSLFNLLYLYPRLLIRQQKGSSGRSQKNIYSIRIRLIQSVSEISQSKDVVESRNKLLGCFHNPAPWAGPSMLKSVYTRILDGNIIHDEKAGIAMSDEFKLRLPMVLDGNYFLHFSLFSIDLQDDSTSDNTCGLSTRLIAETSIPLSSSSTRDPSSGSKVATIIPNGCHRLKLGDFQLQVESRLISSIHISDPAVATALRDFPLLGDDSSSDSQAKEVAILRASSRLRSTESAPEKVPYSHVFSKASGSVLTSHFHPLLIMHLSNLVNLRRNKSISTDETFLMESMYSFLEVCRQVKANFLSNYPGQGKERSQAFFKMVIDSFDERCLRSEGEAKEDVENDHLVEIQFEPAFQSINPSDTNESDYHDELFDGGAVRKRKKDRLGDLVSRITRTFTGKEALETPFSRVAYGASKTDRMRIEAELDNRAHLGDDDETVVTRMTDDREVSNKTNKKRASPKILSSESYLVDDEETIFTAETRMSEARDFFDKAKERLATPRLVAPERPESTTAESRVEAESNTFNLHDFTSFTRSISELGIAQRARTAAEVMIAPCVAVAPGALQSNLASLFSQNELVEGKSEDELLAMRMAAKVDGEQEHMDEGLYSPGSDIEESDDEKIDDLGSLSGGAYYTSEGTFRSPWNCQVMHFSISRDQNSKQNHLNLPMGRGDFIYESLLVIWLRVWQNQDRHTKKINLQTGSSSSLKYSFLLPSFSGDSQVHDSTLTFFDHLDILMPLCLKSIILRYSSKVQDTKSRTNRVIVDQGHMNVLESFVEMLALSLMGKAVQGIRSKNDESLRVSLNLSDHVLDFFVGLCAVLHPAQMDVLIRRYFKVLRLCEPNLEDHTMFKWSNESLYFTKCSRQLRLRAVERLAILPNFVALNYPCRVLSSNNSNIRQKATWTSQYKNATDQGYPISDKLRIGGDDLLPKSGWLADLLANESLSICALSCEAVVAEAMAHMESKESDEEPTATLDRSDLLMFQSIAIHAITTVHELLLRHHAMDRRFQRESSRGRVAALFARPIFDQSLASVRWLARLESTHKVRSLWLLCFIYVLQETPENLLRQAVRSYSSPMNLRIHRFIRLLRLGSSTFQSFIDQPRHCMFPSEIDISISPWLLQESFNTICATIIVVVEECTGPLSVYPNEQKTIVNGILDLLLHVLTTPQSSVTHLRAVGGAIQALESFGIEMFLGIKGSLQHWIRVILGLMNNIALSVRSIAVDFVVSLLGGAFDLSGNIDELALIFATVLPEVTAREIALHSISGQIHDLEDAERAVWPLRRSFADIEDANPLDDDRVDPQLTPLLSVFCRACQAIIDGVLIEMRLQLETCDIVGTKMKVQPSVMHTFDADEESLFEAANFFMPETAPMQRIRWLMTLKSLHKAKGQWVEAAESLIMCARTISDSISHLESVWRPVRFPLWSDSRRSIWLATVGQEAENPEIGNEQVMGFANKFLEGEYLGGLDPKSWSMMCELLTSLAKEAVSLYLEEDGMAGLAYTRLESLLKVLMGILEDHSDRHPSTRRSRSDQALLGKEHVEQEASLRKVIATISFDMTKLAERLLLIAEESGSKLSSETVKRESATEQTKDYFVRILLSGKKPTRFLESTTLPTFLEWDAPCICRVPKEIIKSALFASKTTNDKLEDLICSTIGKPILNALIHFDKSSTIVFNTVGRSSKNKQKDADIFLEIGFVNMDISSFETAEKGGAAFGMMGKHFHYQKPATDEGGKSVTNLVKMTVANPFPCPLSRQRTVLTTEVLASRDTSIQAMNSTDFEI